MIYINLLPVRDILRRNRAKKQMVLSIAAWLCFLTLLSFFGLYQANTIAGLEQEYNDLQAEKQRYAKVLSQIKKIEEDQKILQTRIEVIKQLKQSSSLTVHVLDEVANLTPPHRLWLTRLTQTSADLKLAGMALDNQTVAKYMDDLENSIYIQNVTLVSASMEKFAERDLKSFSISCGVGMPTNEKKITPSP